MDRIFNNFKGFLKIWGVVLLANQILVFGACFAPYCLLAALPHTGVIAAFIAYYFYAADNTEKNTGSIHSEPKDKIAEFFKEIEDRVEKSREFQKNLKENPEPQPLQTFSKSDSKSSFSPHKKAVNLAEDDVLKKRGDGYELHIGRKFELKGDLVIYNGLIQGYEDQGVDIIVLSRKDQTINLIQCKHWKRFEFTREHLYKIYQKLDEFNADYQYLKPQDINQYLSIKVGEDEMRSTIKSSLTYPQIRKTLYLSSAQVVQQDAWKLLESIKNNIYRYKNMKVVIHQI